MNIKALNKLTQEVSKASAFAEEIKNKVNTDLQRISELDTFVSETKQTILTLEQRLKAANETLTKLNDLLS